MNKTYKRALRGILLPLGVALLLMTGCSGQTEPAPLPETQPATVPTEAATQATLAPGQMEYQDQVYQLREGLTSLLVMGLDKFERDVQQIGYTNHMQSDFLMLAVLDKPAGKCHLLHLNRDTMTEIRRLGIGGSAAGTFQGQLALAHTYGSGGSDSDLNAVKAVSTLLGGVKIDHYMTLTMDAVGIINDALGGVTVTVLEDFGDIAPELKKGETVTLLGDNALIYVRNRQGVADQSNLNRMERQRQYLYAFYEKLMAKTQEDDNFLAKTLWKVSNSFTSDCSATALDDLWEEMSQAQLQPIRALEGEALVGEEFMEFYVDGENLQETVLELFYEPVL